MITKRYRYQMYPTAPQRRYLAKLFGSCRVVYNDYLTERRRAYEAGEKMSHGDVVKKVVTQAKTTEERKWLTEVHSQPLLGSVADAKKAYDNFFASVTGKRKGPKMGFPRYKRRGNRSAAYFARTSNAISLNLTTHGVGILQLPGVGLGKGKTKPLDRVRFSYHRELPDTWSSVTVIAEPDGSYWLSFVVNLPESDGPAPEATKSAGLDAGIGDDLLAIAYTDGTREKVVNSRSYRRQERKLARAQRKLSRAQNGSNRRKRHVLRVAKIHAKIKRMRDYTQHVVSKKLVEENNTIVVETLYLSGMSKNRRLAKSVLDAGIASLYTKIEYKSRESGRMVVKVDRWLPSTRTCSVCGTYREEKLSLSTRNWVCESCGCKLDRDYNAAVNLLVAGGLSETLNERGADVRRKLACADGVEALTVGEDGGFTFTTTPRPTYDRSEFSDGLPLVSSLVR